MRLITARRRNHKSRGQATIEFAVSIIAVIVTVFLSWELLMAMYTASVLANAAKEGVRWGIVRGPGSADCGTPPSFCAPPAAFAACTAATAGTYVEAKVKCYASYSLHDISAINVSVSYPDGGGSNDVGNRVVVTVSYNYVPYINVPFAPAFTTHAAGRIVN